MQCQTQLSALQTRDNVQQYTMATAANSVNMCDDAQRYTAATADCQQCQWCTTTSNSNDNGTWQYNNNDDAQWCNDDDNRV